MVKEKTKVGVGTAIVGALFAVLVLLAIGTNAIGGDIDLNEETPTPRVYTVVLIDDDPTTLFMNEEIVTDWVSYPTIVRSYPSCRAAKEAEANSVGAVDLAIIDGLQPAEYGPGCATEVATLWGTNILCYSNEENIITACKNKGFDGILKTESLNVFIAHIEFQLGLRPK